MHQGSLTSPNFFNIYVNGLIKELKSTRTVCHIGDVFVNSLSCADDTVLIGPSINELKKLLGICEQYEISNRSKTYLKVDDMLISATVRKLHGAC